MFRINCSTSTEKCDIGAERLQVYIHISKWLTKFKGNGSPIFTDYENSKDLGTLTGATSKTWGGGSGGKSG